MDPSWENQRLKWPQHSNHHYHSLAAKSILGWWVQHWLRKNNHSFAKSIWVELRQSFI